MRRKSPIRVLVVDDSAVVRRLLTKELSQYEDIEVVDSAIDPYVARDKIMRLRPDVLTLDIEMPRMDGLSFLSALMRRNPMPVIILSSLAPQNSPTALKALQMGAVDVVGKPSSQFSTPDVLRMVRAIRAAAAANVKRRPMPEPQRVATPKAPLGGPEAAGKIIAVGASTGGTIAIEAVLRELPPNMAGTVIVQHMPKGFTASFAKRLEGVCKMAVKEARSGDAVLPGVALLAPGDRHMLLRRNGDRYLVQLKDGPPVHHQRPAVDPLFYSVARHAGPNAVGVILTGMGADGAKGLLSMREAGAHTIAQSQDTCVVYGMPKEAIKLGAASQIVPLPRVPAAILGVLAKGGAAARA